MVVHVLYVICICLLAIPFYSKAVTKKYKRKQVYTTTPLNTKNLLESLYKSINGFMISDEERTTIEKRGGNPTYGEITFDSLQTLLHDLRLTIKDVFYDLGCGIGKVCVQVALTTPAQAIGIELSSSRVQQAQKVRQELIDKKTLKNKNKLKFIEDDITKADLHDATVIFMCSTCFSDELMKKLTQKMAKLKKGLQVITLRELPTHPKFIKTNTYQLPMTWSSSSPVYVYRLEKS